MLEDRFRRYILGGKIGGTDHVEPGCDDKTLPLESHPLAIPYPLYFAGYSPRWGGTSGAFVDLRMEDAKSRFTLAKMYLIKTIQFLEVVKQENDQNSAVHVDFKKLVRDGSYNFDASGAYGKAIHVGKFSGIECVTFTSAAGMDRMPIGKPSEAYLRVIMSGLRETWNLGAEKIADYLISKPGVAGNYGLQQLLDMQKVKMRAR
jgi:hypothetical protein